MLAGPLEGTKVFRTASRKKARTSRPSRRTRTLHVGRGARLQRGGTPRRDAGGSGDIPATGVRRRSRARDRVRVAVDLRLGQGPQTPQGAVKQRRPIAVARHGRQRLGNPGRVRRLGGRDGQDCSRFRTRPPAIAVSRTGAGPADAQPYAVYSHTPRIYQGGHAREKSGKGRCGNAWHAACTWPICRFRRRGRCE